MQLLTDLTDFYNSLLHPLLIYSLKNFFKKLKIIILTNLVFNKIAIQQVYIFRRITKQRLIIRKADFDCVTCCQCVTFDFMKLNWCKRCYCVVTLHFDESINNIRFMICNYQDPNRKFVRVR